MNINLSFKRKKASSVLDIILVVVLLFVVALGLIFAKYIFDDMNTEFQLQDDLGTEAKTMLNDVNDSYTGWSDPIFGFLFFGLIIFLLIGSYLIDSHPVFLVISVVVFVFIVFIMGAVTNSFEETMAEDEFLALQDDYPITMYIMNHLILLISITFALMLIILYGKQQGGGVM